MLSLRPQGWLARLFATRTGVGGMFGCALACSLTASGQASAQSGNWVPPVARQANYAAPTTRLTRSVPAAARPAGSPPPSVRWASTQAVQPTSEPLPKLSKQPLAEPAAPPVAVPPLAVPPVAVPSAQSSTGPLPQPSAPADAPADAPAGPAGSKPARSGAAKPSDGAGAPLTPPRPPRDADAYVEPIQPPRGARGDAGLEAALVLAEAEQLALAQHPALIEAQARIQAAQGQWLQAGLYPNPIAGYSGQQLGSRGQAEQEGVVMQGELVLGGKLRLNRAVAEQQIIQAEMEFAGRQLRVLTNVRKSFYEVLVAQRRVDLNDQLVSVGAKGLQAAETLFQAKEVGRADVLQARIEAQQARILQFNARNRSAAAWRELAAAIGREDLGLRPVEGDVSDDGRDYEWEPMRQRLLGSSPELAVALATAQRAQAAVARARVEPIPNLTIQGIVQRDASTDSTNGALQATLPIPVFNRNQGNIRAAEGEWIAAEQAVRRLELELQSRLAPVYERYRNAKQQVERYREDILPNAKETLDLIQASYEAGESSYLALLTAQRTYFQTNLAYLDALRELWSAIWEMEGLLVTP